MAGDTYTSVELLSAKGSFDSAVSRLEQMAESWSADFVPEISSLQPIKEKDENGEDVTITPAQQYVDAVRDAADRIKVDDNAAVRIAERIGKRQADAAKQSKIIMEAYGAK